ncbi:MAG: dihydrodipicolinate synthase [Clostridia bacterium]|jgi:4-hydroxy-tetrahydrodipicolinate synthase|nr:dihydrodipicolinate synthase [Clostridia bacterium]
MKKNIFKGSAVAIVTPFTKEGIDFEKLGELIEFQIEEGTSAIVVCGTTGEASTMSCEEQKAAIEYTVKKVNKRIPVVAGTGSNNTHHAIALSQFAQQVACDGVLCVTPYYNKTTQKGLYEHFKMIAESITIPMILYNVPARTNLNILPETVRALSEIGNIVGIKECQFAQVGEIVKLCGSDFAVYSGEDGNILPLLSMGGMGVISVMANIIPRDTQRITQKFFEGDLKESLRLQLQTLDLIKALFIETSPIPVKAALNLMGFDIGLCRMPLVEMEEGHLKLLKDELRQYKLID